MLRPPARKRTLIPSASSPSTTDAKAPRGRGLWPRLDVTPQHIGISVEKMNDRRAIPRSSPRRRSDGRGCHFSDAPRPRRAERAHRLLAMRARSVAADEGRARSRRGRSRARPSGSGRRCARGSRGRRPGRPRRRTAESSRRRGGRSTRSAATAVIWLRGAWRRKQIRSSGARPGLEMRPSPCQGVPYIQTTSPSWRSTTRSSLKIFTPGSGSQSRAIVVLPAPDCPAKSVPRPSASTTPLPWMATPRPRASRCTITSSSSGYCSG